LLHLLEPVKINKRKSKALIVATDNLVTLFSPSQFDIKS